MAHRTALWIAMVFLSLATLRGFTQALPGQPNPALRSDRIVLQREMLPSSEADLLVMYADATSPMPRDLPQSQIAPRPRTTPALSPDGQTLVFASKIGERFKLFAWKLDDQNSALGTPERVTNDPRSSEKFPAWSPDGAKLAYIASDGRSTTLRVIERDGAGMRTLAVLKQAAPPVWHPDGQRILCIDIESKKTVLKSVPVSGGAPTQLRRDLVAVAASYSPDGNSIAVLARGDKNTQSLWIIPQFGMGGKPVLKQISGARSICWPHANTIVFNAARVGDNNDSALWRVSPDGKTVTGISGYADPKSVSYITVRGINSLPNDLTAMDPNAPVGPDQFSEAPAQRVPTGPVTIISPMVDATISGKVMVKIAAKSNVDSVTLSIGDKFAFSSVMQASDDGYGQATMSWDTQAIKEVEPDKGLPTSYAQALRYPDKTYTITVKAIDIDKNVIGTDSITVTVKNALPAATLKDKTVLTYNYSMQQRLEEFQIDARGMLTGDTAKEIQPLDASLHAIVRSWVIDVKPSRVAEVRTTLVVPDGKYPLTSGMSEMTIPETGERARYLVSPNGHFSVVPQLARKVYVPVSQVSVQFPLMPVQIGTEWECPMWVVPELLARQGVVVNARNVIEGVEKINGKSAIRIKSEYDLNDSRRFALSLSPIQNTPGLYAKYPGARVKTVDVLQASGIRFSWFDPVHGKLLRVEDMILYRFPLTNVPQDEETPSGLSGNTSSQSAAASPGMPAAFTGALGIPGFPGMGTGPGPNGAQVEPVKKIRQPLRGMTWYTVRYSYVAQQPAQDAGF